MRSSVAAMAYQVLMLSDVELKVLKVHELYTQAIAGELDFTSSLAPEEILVPGRPNLPELVAADLVGERASLNTVIGRMQLIHALAHIEFNAINLALDAVYRFRCMPEQYYLDWLRVAKEEAEHFSLLNQHLIAHDCAYGDFVAHNNLWNMAIVTAHSALVRMALVPRVMEARGLDVSAVLINKLIGCGDRKAANIMQKIMQDEVEHVIIGNRWYHFLCEKEQVDPIATFFSLVEKHAKGFIRNPIAYELRMQAGFSAQELELLKKLLT